MGREPFSLGLMLAAHRGTFVFTPLRHERPLGWSSRPSASCTAMPMPYRAEPSESEWLLGMEPTRSTRGHRAGPLNDEHASPDAARRVAAANPSALS